MDTARWCLLDFLGCILGSSFMEGETRRLAGFVHSLGDREEATVPGLGLRTSCRSAALAYGTMAEMLEFQDTYGYAAYHPASCIIPAALAVAEANHQSGGEFLAAVVAGYEASMRIGAAVGQSCVNKGFMSTGTLGTFGAAVAAGKLLGLDSAGLADAMGIAGYLLPFSMAEDSLGGYSVRTVNGGHAARTGIEAALMALNGYTGSHRILEGSANPDWGFCSMAGGPHDLSRITGGLGDYYYIKEISFKQYPCCGLPQTAVEAVIELKATHQLQPSQVEKVLVRTYASAVSRVGSNYPTSASSFAACQFSMPYLMAAAIKHGQITLRQFAPDNIHDPEVLELSARVQTVEDSELTRLASEGARPSIVEVTTRNGSHLSNRVEFRKGDPVRPLTDQELLAKFRRLAAEALSEDQSRRCEELALGMEDVKDVAELVSACNYPRARS